MKMTHGPERLMMYFIGLLIIVVGVGLATGRNPQSEGSGSYPSPVPAQVQAPVSAIPVAGVGPVVVPKTAAPARMVTEGEWLGLEVAPITPVTAVQYGIPYGTRGLVIAEAEAQALTAGLRAGDVMLSVNGTPISNMTDFFQTTWNGTLSQGMVEVLRKGQKLAVDIPQTMPPALAAAPNTPVVASKTAVPAKPVIEGEWLGLEVVPLTPVTAVQYGIPYGTRGLVIAEAEAQALTAGLRAGDVVLSVNGTPISNMADFFQATWNGTMSQGVVEVLRKGQKLAVNIPQPTNPASAGVANTTVNAPSRGIPAPPQQKASVVAINQAFPQTAASSQIKMLPFQEAHWQGLEVIPLTQSLGRVLKIPTSAKGVIVDDVTRPADMEGFQAGDLITSVGQVPTPTLESFIKAADRVRDRRQTEIRLLRKSQPHNLVLAAFQDRLGTANGETAPMIKPESRPPHGYQGPCTQCHRIGTKGQLAMDQGDLLAREALLIRANQMPPHRNRGECTACHKIVR